MSSTTKKPRRPRSGQRVRRASLTPPTEFGGDLLLWAAWLYYEEGLTQETVAETLGVSRATVNNLLQEAREQRIVTIAIAPDLLQTVRLSREVAARFGLANCLVVPGGRPADAGFERIGRAGARLLTRMIAADDVLGVAWGRTVLALSRALPMMALPHVSVVQITGSAISTESFSPEFCTSNIANRLGARCVNLHAPGIVSAPEVKRILMAEPTVRQQFSEVAACNKVLFGIAAVDPFSLSQLAGYLTADAAEPYIRAGAAGVLAGRFLGRDGRPMAGALDERMIGLTLDEIHRIPERICVAGGAPKVEAIGAMLRGGYATTLVTDEEAAIGLLRMA